ncbi:hypothetical protein, partial [Companilactobacillus zhongbaensis]|uniref:hypothetical protein n=1 Tax=Companilactobacillus zhongbaensis TaxID=2486009 RepID=UPI000F7B60D7
MRANKLSKFNKIKYKDLAIAVALSGASLLLVPTTAQADATNTPSSDQESSVTQTQKKVSAPNMSNTTIGSITPNLSDNLTKTASISTDETETTNTSLEKSNTTPSTAETTPVYNEPQNTATATATATQTKNTAPISESNDTSSQPANETSTLTEPTPTVESTTLTSSATDLKPASYAVVNGQTQAPYSIPANGVSVANIPNSSPVNGKCNIYIQAVDLSGKPYGTKQLASSVPTNVSTAIFWNWRSEEYLSNSFKNVHYSLNPWSPTYNSAPFNFDITDKDVIVSVYMVRPSMSAHFVYYDETAEKVIAGGSFPYSYNDHPEFQTSGVRPPMAVLSDGKLTVDDSSDFDMTNIDAVNYFGPTGMIFNNSSYVLDLAKSGNVTPLDYAQWPLEDFTKVFYYKEATAPAITVDAVDQYGDLLKTFSNTQLSSTNTMINADDLLPDSDDISIANNTFAGINIIKSGSVSGQPDETDTYQMTPTQYADFLNGQHSYDSRLLGDYQKVEIQLAYKVDTVKLYIQPVDPVGNKVGDPIPVGVGSIGKNATIFAPPVTGYSPQVASVSVIVQPDQGPINFPYISATDIDPSHGGTYLYEGGFDKLPDSGVIITNTGAVSTDPTAEHTISVQAVDTDGNPLGAAIPVTSATANTTAELDWSNSLISLLNKSVPNVSQYQLWNADALVGSLSVPVKTQDVVVDVIYALPKVTTTFNFVDMTTGKTLLTETNTWDLNDPTNGYTYKTQGIRPPMTVIDSTTGQLVADDPSSDPVTDPADLPFFGPAGNIYNTGAYQLNSLMSGLTTPTRYIKWPSANLTKTFNYMESPDPTFTVDSVNQNGTVIKTFSAPTVVSTLPAPQLKMTDLYPADADTQINGYTLTGFHVHATGSYFNGTDYDNTVAMTPDQYAQFINSPGAQSTIDERALAAHQNYHIQMTYVGNNFNLTVQPVDETGAKIGDPITVGTGQVGSTSTITAPQVSGYQAVTPTSELVVAPYQSSVSVTYKKAATVDPGTTGTGTTTGGSDSGNTGSGTTTGSSDSGNTGSGTTTGGSDSGSTGTGSTTGGSDSGSTGSGSTTGGSDSGSTGTGSTTGGSDSGNTSSGTTTGGSDSGNTGSGTTTGGSDSGSTGTGSTTGGSDSGSTSSGTTTGGSDSGNTGSGTTTGGSDSGNTGSGTTSGGSDSGNTGSGSTTGGSDSGNTGTGTTTGGSDSGSTGTGSNTGGSDSGNTSSGTTTGGSDSGNTGTGT